MARKAFIANVTSASFVQMKMSCLAVTEGLFYLIIFQFYISNIILPMYSKNIVKKCVL